MKNHKHSLNSFSNMMMRQEGMKEEVPPPLGPLRLQRGKLSASSFVHYLLLLY